MADVDRQKPRQGAGGSSRRLSLGRWLIAAVLFVLMGCGAAWGVVRLQAPDVLPLKVVRIDGEFRYLKRSALEQAVAKAVQGNFFTVDVEAVRRTAAHLAWVDEVRVRRVWPDTLQMWVKEQTPLALWGKGAVVNDRGELFRPGETDLPGGLPRLSGPDESVKTLAQQLRRMTARFRPLGLQIERLRLDERRALSARFAQGLILQIGRVDVARRLARFVHVYPRLKEGAAGRRIRRVDLRYVNGLAVYSEKLREHKEEMKSMSGVISN